ncbi:MAG: hypothetical protein ACRYGM_03490 [Janthinobacterium lividum]
MKVVRDDPPMPQEIAAGFYPAFEDGWRRTEWLGRAVMVLFIAACVLGLLGPGLFSKRHAANPDRSITAEYDAVVRFGAPTVIQLDTKVPDGKDLVAVTMARQLVDAFGLEAITPDPQSWQAGDDSVRITFPVVPGQKRVFIRLAGSPSFRGGQKLWVRLDAGESLAWSQFSVP